MSEIVLSIHDDFNRMVEDGVSLVDFNAPWCGPCRAQDPIISQLEKDYDDKAAFVKVNIDEHNDIAMKLGIQSIPTIIIFQKGREVKRLVGLQTAGALSSALNNLLDQ